MAALAAAMETATPDKVQQLKERYPEEDARKLFALLASKKGDIEETAALYEVTEQRRTIMPVIRHFRGLTPFHRPYQQNTMTGIPRMA